MAKKDVLTWISDITSPRTPPLARVAEIHRHYPGKRPQTVCVCVCVCVRSVSRKSRDLDALGSREVMVVMKVGIVVAVVVSE